MTDPVDRSNYPTRKTRLGDETPDPRVAAMTPGERVAMVQELTAQAWAFKDGHWDEPRLRRDVVRTLRGGR